MRDLTATIAAISTPPGKGGVALIRVSGADAFAIADRCFRPATGSAPLSARAPRTAVRGDFLSGGESVDDGLAFRFPAPHSYTGEDTVEFTCHGGVLVSHAVLEGLYAAGAVPATAGEFTRRAYLNGTLTLTEADAIGQLLEATSQGQMRLAARKSRTRLAVALDGLHERLVTLIASLYATIDYPEEDLAPMTDEEVLEGLRALDADLSALLVTYKTGHSIRVGIPTVLCGRPNVGKSSLYNLLCREDAAIVTDVPGTTRDLIERTVSLGDLTLRLTDTAGLRETDDTVEKIGVARTRDALSRAELVLAVLDASEPLTPEDEELLDTLRAHPGTVILCLNKCDKAGANAFPTPGGFHHVVRLSAKSGDAKPLTDCILTLFAEGAPRVGEDAILSDARQFGALSRARELLAGAADAVAAGVPAEVACSEAERALGCLSEADGRAVSEEIIDSIFSHFCIGK